MVKSKTPPNRIKKQNTDNRNATNTSSTKLMLTQEDNINLELLKKIITEKKTILPFMRNQDAKKLSKKPKR